MMKSIVLLSDVDISHEEFIKFLRTIDVMLYPSPYYDGRMSFGKQHVWIVLENHEQLEVFLADMTEQEQKSMFNAIVRELGNIPKSSVLLDVSNSLGSISLAVTFIHLFLEHWHCVIYDLREEMYTKDNFRTMREID